MSSFKISRIIKSVLVVALVAVMGVVSSDTWGGNAARKIDIETAMREFNARYNYLSLDTNEDGSVSSIEAEKKGSYVKWPSCPGCGGNVVVPPKPKKEFYKLTTDNREHAAHIVGDVVKKFYVTHAIYQSFVKGDGLADIAFDDDGTGALIQPDTFQHKDVYAPGEDPSVSDFPKTWESTSGEGVTAKNVEEAAETITEYIQKLKRLAPVELFSRSAGPDGTGQSQGKRSWANAGLGGTISEARNKLKTNLEGMAIGGNHLEMLEWDEHQGGGTSEFVFSGLSVSEGTIICDDMANKSSGKAAIYLKIWTPGKQDYIRFSDKKHWDQTLFFRDTYEEGTANSPPVTSERTSELTSTKLKWVKLEEISASSTKYISAKFGDNSLTAPSKAMSGTLTDSFFQYYGWSFVGSKVIYDEAPEFDISADEGECSKCESGDCEDGDTSASIEEDRGTTRTGIGPLNAGQDAGYTYISATKPSADLSLSTSLQARVATGVTVQWASVAANGTPTGTLKWIDTGKVFLHVSTINSDSYKIDLYHRDDLPSTIVFATSADLDPIIPANTYPFRSVKYENTYSSIGTAISGTFTVTGTSYETTAGGVISTRKSHFEWVQLDTNPGKGDHWKLYEGYDSSGSNPTRITANWEINVVGVAGQTKRTRAAYDPATPTTLIRRVEDFYQQYAWGKKLIKRVVGLTGDTKTTNWAYHESGNGLGKLKSVEADSGYWEKYTYHSDGTLATTVSQIKSANLLSSVTDSAADQNVEVSYYYHDTFSLSDGDGKEDLIDIAVTRIPDATLGQKVVKTEFYVDLSQTYKFKDDLVKESFSFTAAVNPSIDFSDTDDVKTYLNAGIGVSPTHEDFRTANEVARRWIVVESDASNYVPLYSTVLSQTSDGQISWETASSITESKSYSGIGKPSYISSTPLTISVTLSQGTRSTNISNDHGRSIYSSEAVLYSGATINLDLENNWAVQSVSDVTSVDDFGRALVTDYYVGAQAEAKYPSGSGTASYTIEREYACCGVKFETDRNGIKTRYHYDDMGRVKQTDTIDTNETPNVMIASSASTFDDEGRVLKTYRAIKDNPGPTYTVTTDWQVQSENSYAANGELLWQKDVLGKKTYPTDRKISITGGSPVSGQEQYTENRTYSNNTGSTGLVNVTWTNSLGQTVREFVATAAWTAGTTPSGTATLTQQSRTTMTYDWAGRTVASRTFHTLPSTIANEGTAADYYESQNLYYDTHGRLILSKDALGNYTGVVYGHATDVASSGKMIEQYTGTDVEFENEDWNTGTKNMVMVSAVFYDTDRDRTGSPAGYTTRSTTLSPGDGLNYIGVNYKNFILADGSRLSWTLPDKGADNTQAPSSLQMTDDQGRSEASMSFNLTTAQQDGLAWDIAPSFDTVLLAKSEPVYGDTAKPWRATGSTTHVIDYGTGSDATLTSTVVYDSRGRQIKTISPIGGNYSVTKYDDTKAGRVESQKQYTGGTSGSGGKLIAQSEPLYEDTAYPTRVTGNRSYDRRPDLTGPEPTSLDTSNARRNTSYVWFDTFGRPIASANLGTVALDEGALDAYDPDDPYVAGEIGGSIVTETTYNLLGQTESIKANDGKVTKFFYDTLGRQKYAVENYDARTTGADPFDPSDESGTGDTTDTSYDRVTKYTYNAYGQTEQIALDPNGDGTTTDQQITTYKYAGMTGYDTDATDGIVGLARYGHLVETVYPDTDASTTNDSVYQTYYPNGDLKTRTDQREVEFTYSYNDLGQRTEQKVSSGALPDGDQQVKYTYDSLNRLIKLTTYSAINSTISSEVQNVYDNFGQMTTQYQQIGGAVNTSTSLKVAYKHDTVANAYRLKNYTMPNGRKIHLGYGSGIDDSLSRPVSINEDDGSNGIGDPIVEYTRTGSGAVVAKAYPTPKVRLRHYEGAGAYPGIDSLGRNIQQRWGQYDPASPGTADTSDVFNITYGYDNALNRKYAKRNVAAYKGSSQAYSHDGLNRLKDFKRGRFDGGTDINWWFRKSKQYTKLDALGNQINNTQHDGSSGADAANSSTISEFNKANEITSRKVVGTKNRAFISDGFSFDSSANWESVEVDAAEAETIASHHYTVTDTGNDINKRYIRLLGEDMGTPNIIQRVKIAAGADATCAAGIVFGFKSANDYWIKVAEPTAGKMRVYHVVNGVKGAVFSESTYTYAADAYFYPVLTATLDKIDGTAVNGGFPSGKTGIFVEGDTTVDFDYHTVKPNDFPIDLAGRWDSLNEIGRIVTTTENANLTSDALYLAARNGKAQAILARGIRSANVQVTMMVKRKSTTTIGGVRVVFDAKDATTFKHISVASSTTGYKPLLTYEDGTSNYYNSVNASETGAMPALADASHFIWARAIISQVNSKVTMKVINSTSSVAPTETAWDSPTYKVVYSGVPITGGKVGFQWHHWSLGYVDNVTICTNNNGNLLSNGSPDFTDTGETQLVETFDLDANGRAEQNTSYDDAGNLAYDGIYKYSYDAWNRLVKIEKAYHDGAIQTGSVVGEFAYDGLSRRIQKKVTNSGDFDFTYNYYYNGQQLVETRNASSMVLNQKIWGLTYIDELVQVGINQDPYNLYPGHPATESDCERFFWALTDANYNVMGLVSESGKLVERYEYTPYGGRQVYTHGWILEDINSDGSVDSLDDAAYTSAGTAPDSRADLTDAYGGTGDGVVNSYDQAAFDAAKLAGKSYPVNDPDVLHAAQNSYRSSIQNLSSLLKNNAALNTIGHQGLMHDEEFEVGPNMSLIYNRARTLTGGRYMQRDSLNNTQPGGGYQDGMSLYAYYAGMHGGVDPSGLRMPYYPTSAVGAFGEFFRRVGNIPGYVYDSIFGKNQEANKTYNFSKTFPNVMKYVVDKVVPTTRPQLRGTLTSSTVDIPLITVHFSTIAYPGGTVDIDMEASGSMELCCRKKGGHGVQLKIDAKVRAATGLGRATRGVKKKKFGDTKGAPPGVSLTLGKGGGVKMSPCKNDWAVTGEIGIQVKVAAVMFASAKGFVIFQRGKESKFDYSVKTGVDGSIGAEAKIYGAATLSGGFTLQ